MNFYYSRISNISQSASRQYHNFKNIEGFDSNNLFVDKVQGNVPFLERVEAAKLFDTVTATNGKHTIVVDSIDRLGRSLVDILNTIELFNKNSINLKSLKEGFETLLPNGDENPIAKVVCSVMGSIGEMERNRIKQRTAEGIAIAKAKGKYKGRKVGSSQSNDKLLERHKVVVTKLKKGLTVREINSMTGKSSATIIKVKKVLEQKGEL